MAENLVIQDKNYLVRDMLERGIDNSARSLGMMINCEVLVTDFELEFASAEFLLPYTQRDDNKVLLLKTELVGAISGINYVMLTKEEVKILCEQSVDAEVLLDSSAQLTIEFLKEIENILAASTISAIADRLNVNIYGDVPKIEAVFSALVNDVILKESSKLNTKLYAKCKFQIPGMGISPEILWLFNGAIISSFRALC